MQGLEKAQRQYDRQEPTSPCRSEGREYSAPEVPPPGAQITRSVLFINPREGRMAPKYTTGLSAVDGNLYQNARSVNVRCVGVVYGWVDAEARDWTLTEEAKANSELWAAAPELVTLLQAANNKLGAMQRYHSGPAADAIHALRKKIDAALAKAGAV